MLRVHHLRRSTRRRVSVRWYSKQRITRNFGHHACSRSPSPLRAILLCLLSSHITILFMPGIARSQNNAQPATNPSSAAGQTSEKLKSDGAASKEETFPIRVFGRALDVDGKPISGAKVYLASENPAYRRIAETVTDKNGRYKFTTALLPLARNEGNSGYQASGFEAFGQADGYGFAWRPTKWFYLDHKPTNLEPGPDEP